MSVKVLLGLGSNKSFENQSPAELLGKAVSLLSKTVKNMKISSLYESKAMYVENQESFLNLAVYGDVSDSLSPFSLLSEIHKIERILGRARKNEIRFGPRSIDIDIEEFGSFKVETEDLILPHPRMKERMFVLIPSLEIFSENADELKTKEIISMMEKLPDQNVRKAPEKIQNEFVSFAEVKSF